MSLGGGSGDARRSGRKPPVECRSIAGSELHDSATGPRRPRMYRYVLYLARPPTPFTYMLICSRRSRRPECSCGSGEIALKGADYRRRRPPIACPRRQCRPACGTDRFSRSYFPRDAQRLPTGPKRTTSSRHSPLAQQPLGETSHCRHPCATLPAAISPETLRSGAATAVPKLF